MRRCAVLFGKSRHKECLSGPTLGYLVGVERSWTGDKHDGDDDDGGDGEKKTKKKKKTSRVRLL